MVFIKHDHRRIEHRSIATKSGLRVGRPSVGQTRKNLSKLPNIGVVVGGLRITVRAESVGTIGIELIKTNREQLHDLTRVILVREGVRHWISLSVIDMTEVEAHRGVEGHRPQKITVVAETVRKQGVVIIREAHGIIAQHPRFRHNKQLCQRVGRQLAKLVGRR